MTRLRVATVDGHPTSVPPCPRDQRFLTESAQLLPALDCARRDLSFGLAEEDWQAVTEANRDLFRLGCLLAELNRGVGAAC